MQELAPVAGASPYTLQSIGSSGFLAIASPGERDLWFEHDLFAHCCRLLCFTAALLFVPYVNPTGATVTLSAAGAATDPVGVCYAADIVWTNVNVCMRARVCVCVCIRCDFLRR